MTEILKSENKQFSLMEDGKVFWQQNSTNPTPGEHIGHIEKGENNLSPKFILDDVPLFEKMNNKKDIEAFVSEQVSIYIKTALEGLFNLVKEDDEDKNVKEDVKNVLSRVHNSFGIISREKVDEQISKFDQDDRKIIRKKYLKMGPLLLFVPTLNKPAAVKLKAMLWNIWNGVDLPAVTPHDGIVSQVVDKENIVKPYYRSIGYPVYGPRAIRIDMLDRVVNLIYETADNGEFKAQHKMAEWLGCPINDLYEILESMGHRKIVQEAPKIEEPINDAVEAVSSDSPEPIKQIVEEKSADTVLESTDKSEEVKDSTEVKPAEPQAKPELASFKLKKGKAFFNRKSPNKSFKDNKKPDSDKSYKKKHDKKKLRDNKPKMISTGPEKKIEDSPFAILQQLKK